MVPVPEKIARFYEVNDVSRFIYDRPIYKGTVDKDNEFKSMWIERTTLDIANPLPGILRWFEVKHKSVQELTPVEFACETMNNVAKELWDLIVQYRNEPKRNINPFSMRLQGIIDANVMGGISKYQEAFFSEQFLKSTQGQGQQANVQKLKSLILEQIQILDQALELHGQLAPAGVQPLHNRLLERFSQLKQSLSGLGRLKRQHSESIVNTPLPPLPTEKRTLSLGTNSGPTSLISASNYYEHDEIYTRPGETLRPVEASNLSLNSFSHNSYQTLSKESLHNNEFSRDFQFSQSQNVPPPVPSRPRSQNFSVNTLVDSPEVPPKRILNPPSSPGAPPLPPRGITPDKRASNPMVFNDFTDPVGSTMPRRPHSISQQHNQKYAVVDISFDDPEADQAPHSLTHSLNDSHLKLPQAPNEFRDSGISTTSAQELNQLNNLNEDPTAISLSLQHRDHCRISTNGNMDAGHTSNLNMNHRENSTSSFDIEEVPMPPPPIPPKSLNIISAHEAVVEGPQSPAMQQLSTHSNQTHMHNHHHHHAHNHINFSNHVPQQQQQQQHHQQNQTNGHSDGYVSPKAVNHTLTNSANSAVAAGVDKNESLGEAGSTF